MYLTISDLKKSYQFGKEDIQVIKSLNARIPLQKLITIMGPSGSGKSTLMNILSGVDKADSGSIKIGDLEISSYNENEITEYRRKKIGIIFQFFNLLPYLTSLENVCIPLYLSGITKKIAKEKAESALDSVGLNSRLSHKPAELSGGEQQRVAIARAIVNEPEFIFADEPTGNLDSENSAKIMNLLKTLRFERNFTIFMVTHNPEIGNLGEVKLTMRDGSFI
jgi:lipoprotein-releasing system ATP-binding protein